MEGQIARTRVLTAGTSKTPSPRLKNKQGDLVGIFKRHVQPSVKRLGLELGSCAPGIEGTVYRSERIPHCFVPPRSAWCVMPQLHVWERDRKVDFFRELLESRQPAFGAQLIPAFLAESLLGKRVGVAAENDQWKNRHSKASTRGDCGFLMEDL